MTRRKRPRLSNEAPVVLISSAAVHSYSSGNDLGLVISESNVEGSKATTSSEQHHQDGLSVEARASRLNGNVLDLPNSITLATTKAQHVAQGPANAARAFARQQVSQLAPATTPAPAADMHCTVAPGLALTAPRVVAPSTAPASAVTSKTALGAAIAVPSQRKQHLVWVRGASQPLRAQSQGASTGHRDGSSASGTAGAGPSHAGPAAGPPVQSKAATSGITAAPQPGFPPATDVLAMQRRLQRQGRLPPEFPLHPPPRAFPHNASAAAAGKAAQAPGTDPGLAGSSGQQPARRVWVRPAEAASTATMAPAVLTMVAAVASTSASGAVTSQGTNAPVAAGGITPTASPKKALVRRGGNITVEASTLGTPARIKPSGMRGAAARRTALEEGANNTTSEKELSPAGQIKHALGGGALGVQPAAQAPARPAAPAAPKATALPHKSVVAGAPAKQRVSVVAGSAVTEPPAAAENASGAGRPAAVMPASAAPAATRPAPVAPGPTRGPGPGLAPARIPPGRVLKSAPVRATTSRGGQYLRPGKHKLVRRMSGGGNRGVLGAAAVAPPPLPRPPLAPPAAGACRTQENVTTVQAAASTQSGGSTSASGGSNAGIVASAAPDATGAPGAAGAQAASSSGVLARARSGLTIRLPDADRAPRAAPAAAGGSAPAKAGFVVGAGAGKMLLVREGPRGSGASAAPAAGMRPAGLSIAGSAGCSMVCQRRRRSTPLPVQSVPGSQISGFGRQGLAAARTQMTWRRLAAAGANAAGAAAPSDGAWSGTNGPTSAVAEEALVPGLGAGDVSTAVAAGVATQRAPAAAAAATAAASPLRVVLLRRIGRTRLRPAIASSPKLTAPGTRRMLAAAVIRRSSVWHLGAAGAAAAKGPQPPTARAATAAGLAKLAAAAAAKAGPQPRSAASAHRRPAASGGTGQLVQGAGRRLGGGGGRSLQLVTVDGRQYYAAGGATRDGVRQLHSLSSVAGKAAAAAALAARMRLAAAARAARSKTAAMAAGAEANAVAAAVGPSRRSVAASHAVRRAVWRRRGLEPTSPSGTAVALAASSAAAAARAGVGGRLGVAAAPMAGGRRAAGVGGGVGGRAAAAQRILAKARMRRAAALAIKTRGFCPEYCRTGVCPLSRDCSSGGRCAHTHDPTKVAVCARWLAGTCKDAACPLQHRRLADLMPLCSYFLQDKCTAADCPYLHKTHPASAPVCRAFLHSYCPRGAACPSLHLTTKMARERARLLGSSSASAARAAKALRLAGPGHGNDDIRAVTGAGRAKEVPGGSGVKRALLGAGGDGPAVGSSIGVGLKFGGALLHAPKRRRGGFRYFDAPAEDFNEPSPKQTTAAASASGSGFSSAPGLDEAQPGDTPGPLQVPVGAITAGEGVQGTSGTAGKDRGSRAAAGGPLLLRGGMKLYL